MQGRTTLLLILSLGTILPLGLYPGCTSEQWVKDYVKGETASLQSVYTKRYQELEDYVKGENAGLQESLNVHTSQITEIRASLEAMDKKFVEWQKSLEELMEAERLEGEIINLRSEIKESFARLEDMERDLSRLKELQQITDTSKDKELAVLATELNDAKRLVEMNITEVLKSQNRLKEFVIEEVRVLRLERQEYAKELEDIKSRLQTIENAMGEKKHPEI